jgi:hypothetical protein
MPRAEDLVYVLRRFREALVPDGIMLDPQVIRPHRRIETDRRIFCAALVEDWAPNERKLPAEAMLLLQTIERECAGRERYRLRRLGRADRARSRR